MIRRCTRLPPSRRGWRVDVRRPTLHVGGSTPRRAESVALVQSLGVASEEGKAAEALEVGVLEDALHQPFRESTAAIGFDDKYVGEIGIGRAVRGEPREASLCRAVVDAEDERILKRGLE